MKTFLTTLAASMILSGAALAAINPNMSTTPRDLAEGIAGPGSTGTLSIRPKADVYTGIDAAEFDGDTVRVYAFSSENKAAEKPNDLR